MTKLKNIVDITILFPEANKTAVVILERDMGRACEAMLSCVSHYKLHSTRMDKLWEHFHRFSLGDGLTMCKSCDTALGLEAHEVFWQLFMERNLFAQLPATESVPHQRSRKLNRVEENAVRYTAGYVIRKLTKKYSSSKTSKAAVFLDILRNMGGKISSDTTEVSPSSEWTHSTDRGGLFHVSDAVYDLFLLMEITVDDELTHIFQSKGKGIEKVRKEKLEWLCLDEEVQIVWSILCSLEDEEFEQELLKEIAFTWITTRGHSKAHIVKEQYKNAKQTPTSGKRSLRKELLKKQDAQQDDDNSY